jgi:pSer/pThr/pTyr-binding forkhead associated (FHA) protein
MLPDIRTESMANGFYIEIVAPTGPSRFAAVTDAALLIGRSAQRCKLVLDDARVSRIHLRVTRHPETGVTVTDMYSANGSLLDGRQLPPGIPFHWLIQQNILIGSTLLILRYGDLSIANH